MLRNLIAAIAVAIVLGGSPWHVIAQDGTEFDGTPVVESGSATESDQTVVETVVVEPDQVEEPNSDPEAVDTSNDTPTTEPVTESPQAFIDAFAAASPDCELTETAESDVLAPGGAVVYRCQFHLDVAGLGTSPEEVSAFFTTSIAVADGVVVRLRTTLGDDAAWSDGYRHEVVFLPEAIDPASIVFDLGAGEDGSLVGSIAFWFELELSRANCEGASGTIDVRVEPTVFTANRDDVIVNVYQENQEAEIVAPVLAVVDYAAPSVSIESVTIAAAPFSLDSQSVPATVEMLVESTAFACSPYAVTFALDLSTGGTYLVASVMAPLVPDEPISADSGVAYEIGWVPAGTEPGAISIVVTLNVTIPGGLVAGSFGATATASIVPMAG